jgi:ABC-type multidrug transport system fused ATPase/permease subunit
MVIEAKACMNRLTTFFNLVDSFEKYIECPEDFPKGGIEIENGEFVWETAKSKGIAAEFNKMIESRKSSGDPKVVPEAKNEQENQEQKKKDKIIEERKTLVTEKDELITPRTLTGRPLNTPRSQNENVTLANVNLKINPGEFYAVVGTVGSGKSSLIHAIIGEMFKLSGHIKVKGTLAYVPQTAWIVNATLRENIVMDKQFDQEKYDRVVQLCELTEDFKILQGNDHTEIGSKGVNLSGGQKQRVSIARALYADADIYIIDDCLSALDAHVGKSIFHNVLMGALSKKTRVLATHATHFLEGLEHIVVMKQGNIAAIGNYSDLIKSCVEFKEIALLAASQRKISKDVLIEELMKNNEVMVTTGKVASIEQQTEKINDKSEEIKKPEAANKLIIEETQSVGATKLTNYVLLVS